MNCWETCLMLVLAERCMYGMYQHARLCYDANLKSFSWKKRENCWEKFGSFCASCVLKLGHTVLKIYFNGDKIFTLSLKRIKALSFFTSKLFFSQRIFRLFKQLARKLWEENFCNPTLSSRFLSEFSCRKISWILRNCDKRVFFHHQLLSEFSMLAERIFPRAINLRSALLKTCFAWNASNDINLSWKKLFRGLWKKNWKLSAPKKLSK